MICREAKSVLPKDIGVLRHLAAKAPITRTLASNNGAFSYMTDTDKSTPTTPTICC